MMSALPPRSGESPRRGVSRLEMMQVCLGPVTPVTPQMHNPFINQTGLLWEGEGQIVKL